MEKRPCIRAPITFVLLLIGTSFFNGFAIVAKHAKISPGDKDQLTRFVTLLQDEKDGAEDYVLRAKQIKDGEKKEEAHRLYEKAKVDFNHYVTHIFNAVRLGSNADLRAPSEAASSSAEAFENFVEAHTQAKSPTVAIAGAKTVLEIGMNIIDWFTGTKKIERAAQMQKLRHDTADYWQPRLEWRQWEEISAGK